MPNYPYKTIGLPLDLANWEQLNKNFDDIETDIKNISGDVLATVIDDAKLTWQEPVDSFANLATTYPNAETGFTAMTRDTGKVYRFNGTEWLEIQDIDPTAINEVDSRLTSQLAEKAKESDVAELQDQRNNSDWNIQQGKVTPKILYRVGGYVFVLSQKPHGNGYVRFRLRDDVVDTSAISVGGAGQLLRIVEVLNVTEALTLKHAEAANSDAVKWITGSVNYGHLLVNTRTNSGTAPAIGDWIEYSVTIPAGIFGIECLIYGSSSSSTNVTVAVDGVSVQSNVSFNRNPVAWIRHYIPISPGTHTIRFTTQTAQFMSIAGVCVSDLYNYKKGLSYDRAIVAHQGSTNQYVTNGGAMDYAMFDSDVQKFCGSYHGGETRSRLQYLVDGTAVTLVDNDYRIGEVIEIEQDTRINGKIDGYNRQIFRSDGARELELVLGNGSINLTKLFVNMTTTHDSFDEVLYPKRVTIGADGDYQLKLCNLVVQKNAENNQKVTTILNNNILPKDDKDNIPYVAARVGQYNKVYKANIDSTTPIEVTEGNYRVIHIFE